MKKGIVLVTGQKSGRIVSLLSELVKDNDEFKLIAVIFDENKTGSRTRKLNRLKVWFKTRGLIYLIWRLYLAKKSKPQTTHGNSIFDFLKKEKVPCFKFSNINSKEAEEKIKELEPYILVSSGNRIITEKIFSIAENCTINLHHGKIPEFRGGPPCFWELYNQEDRAYVSVHKIDKKIDHGVLLAEDFVEIPAKSTPKSIFEKMGDIDSALVIKTLKQLSLGTEKEISVDFSNSLVRTIPSYFEVKRAERNLDYKFDPFGYKEVKQ